MKMKCIKTPDGGLNIGDWDFKIKPVEIQSAVLGEEGNILVPAVYEDQITNPMPEGCEVVEVDIVEGPDGGLYPVDYVPPMTPRQRIAELEQRNALLQSALDDLILNGGGGL